MRAFRVKLFKDALPVVIVGFFLHKAGRKVAEFNLSTRVEFDFNSNLK